MPAELLAFILSASYPPSLWCQTLLLGTTGVLLALHALPDALLQKLTSYGARNSHHDMTRSSGWVFHQVPHAWFWHFYFVSVCWSAFWAWQYFGRGAVMAALARAQLHHVASTDLGRVYLAWAMMAVQGSRRLFECFFVLRPGSSSMCWVHWLLALVFYTTVGIAIWIHGSGRTILESWASVEPVATLTLRDLSGLIVFLVAWLEQNRCHRYLASLPKYTLPDRGLFRGIVCPHYTCECVIYIALAFVAAPSGRLFNPTLLCVEAFVVANLGVTARGTKQWYAQKFGREKVVGRWNMIPLVF
ncbi:hypothetical protein L249_6465 [Ophiocordyceps polyrhachis-furcata BCC 54312]|uniref:Polyprenal reductase n=1 Tax=Ophiocordyceps polyrhachis-furcata BCC 54312 TaxID=1330021 RepID=A0A367LLD1_9HYPO|nr:hypothetical protein L249_6465 [Ophiocordyceps polyrhachis-furcata BCC 54312]